ncbi:class I adenylate-forming enzyme family protein [Litorivivens sp.]|uniref:class I adenylate-forming enzyme family protein n=1 Tax=Litorivivens sp. TaxID=2020868 RepID=UPI003565F280
MMQLAEIVGNQSLVKGIPLSEEEGVGALTLGSFLKEVSTRYADCEAAVMRTGDSAQRWSYKDLWNDSVRLARALVAKGVTKGTRVGILATNRYEFLTSTFGTALAGGVATTMNTFSTAAELEILLESSACSVLLFERKVLKKDFADILIELEPQLKSCAPGELRSRKFPFLRHLSMMDSESGEGGIEGWEAFQACADETPMALIDSILENVVPADPGVLFFSSGSTGKPKGILSAHRGVCLQMWRWRQWLQFGDDVRSWSANGFFFSGNFAWALGSTLSAGGSMILQPTFQAEEALSLIEQEKVTFIAAWPHQWAQLTDAKNWNDVDLSSLVYIDKNSPVAAHPTVNSNWVDAQKAYGNTETFTISSMFPANTPDDIAAGTHGIPVAGNTFKIVDPLTGEIKPIGESGEIAVKGPTLMLNYIGIPMDDVLDDEGFFRTGDGGFFDERGRLHWEGRINDIIKTGGANVSPVEIDIVLAKCPGVKVTKTVGVPDELLGEIVVSCIVPVDGAEITEDQVRNFAKEKLAAFKVPRRVLFFAEDELEMTGSAKVKAKELIEQAVQRLAAEKT